MTAGASPTSSSWPSTGCCATCASSRRSRHFADTIRHLESVGSAALVDHRVIDRLVDAYRAYRKAAHHLSLEQRPAIVDAGEFAPSGRR